MRPGPVLILLALAGLVGWTAGGAPVADAPAAAGASGEVVLRREGDGHFYARALVKDRPIRFLVDTGATGVALTAADARAAGFVWSDDDLEPVGRGASGTVYGVRVTLPSVELGGTYARNVGAAIIPDGLHVSLLGQSFLKRAKGMRIEGDRMILDGGG